MTAVSHSPFGELSGANRSSLPDELQPQLNLPTVGCRKIDLTRRRIKRSISVEDRVGIERRLEVGVVQDIEKLSPELDVESFRNSRDVIVFEQGEIEVGEIGPNERVSPIIAKKVQASVWVCGYNSWRTWTAWKRQ